MKTLAALAFTTVFGLLQTGTPLPSTPICLVSDCCGSYDGAQTDSINGPFTTVCDSLSGPEINRPIFLKENTRE